MLPRRTGLRHGCWVVGIDLSNDYGVNGRLDFQELTSLEQLNLKDTNAFGDIQVLQHNTKLKHLNLAQAGVVSGNLESLRLLAELTYLNLGYCMDVFGNLEALKNATRLKELHLQKTLVGGDVMALENATELTRLNLANTHVFGDVSRLRSLENFDIAGTEITCKGQDDALREILRQLTRVRVADLKQFPGIEWRILSCRYEVFSCLPLFIFTWFGSALRNMFENWSNWIMLDQSAAH